MTERTFAHKVMYDGLYTFVMRILNVGCAAGLGILTARLLGPAGKGIYALPSVEAGLVISAFGGLGGALSYFLLNRRGREVLRPAFVTSGLFIAIGAVILVPIAFAAHQLWTILPAMASLPGSAAINLATGYAIGIKRVRYSTTLTVGVTVLTLAFMAPGLFFIGRSSTTAIIVWLLTITLAGAIAIAAVLLHARKLERGERVSLSEYWRFSVKVGMVNLVSLLNYRADLYIVAIMTSPAQLGMYTVAVSAAESLLVPTQVAALVTSPHIGSFDRKAAAELTARCVRNNLIVASLVCGLLFLVAHPLIQAFYGPAFLPVVVVLQVLLLGVFAMSLGSPMSTFFTLKLGRPEVPLRLAGLSAAICIAISFALVSRYGMLGAAIASSAAYIVGQIVAVWVFCRAANMTALHVLRPTLDDWQAYASFARSVLANSRALLPFRPTV